MLRKLSISYEEHEKHKKCLRIILNSSKSFLYYFWLNYIYKCLFGLIEPPETDS